MLIDELLERPEYADFWAMRWSDMLRVDRDAVTAQGGIAMTNWLHRQFAENRPHDQFVRDIVTAQGNIASDRPAAFYKVLNSPEIMSRSISQLFLGVRIECAQCHHHPSEKWSQDDYFALAGFFTGVTRKQLPRAGSDRCPQRINLVIREQIGWSAHAREFRIRFCRRRSSNGTCRLDGLADNPYLARRS